MAAIKVWDQGGAEPSGICYDRKRDVLWSVWDNGYVFSIDRGGNTVTSFTGLTGDLEGCCMVPDKPDHLYIAREFNPAIFEVDISGTPTLSKTFDLSGILTAETSTNGMEDLCFVPEPGGAHYGYFLCGSQLTGNIFKVRCELAGAGSTTAHLTSAPYNSPVSTDGIFGAEGTSNDLANMLCDWQFGKGEIYLGFDDINYMYQVSLNGVRQASWPFPAGPSSQEGFCRVEDDLWIADDAGGIWVERNWFRDRTRWPRRHRKRRLR